MSHTATERRNRSRERIAGLRPMLTFPSRVRCRKWVKPRKVKLGGLAAGPQAGVEVPKVVCQVRCTVLVALSVHSWRGTLTQGPEGQEQQLLVHELDRVGESSLLPRSRDEPGEFGGHGSVCLWCSRVSPAGQAGLLFPFPLRALPRSSVLRGDPPPTGAWRSLGIPALLPLLSRT